MRRRGAVLDGRECERGQRGPLERDPAVVARGERGLGVGECVIDCPEKPLRQRTAVTGRRVGHRRAGGASLGDHGVAEPDLALELVAEQKRTGHERPGEAVAALHREQLAVAPGTLTKLAQLARGCAFETPLLGESGHQLALAATRRPRPAGVIPLAQLDLGKATAGRERRRHPVGRRELPVKLRVEGVESG